MHPFNTAQHVIALGLRMASLLRDRHLQEEGPGLRLALGTSFQAFCKYLVNFITHTMARMRCLSVGGVVPPAAAYYATIRTSMAACMHGLIDLHYLLRGAGHEMEYCSLRLWVACAC